jgi:hypothetical protein
VRARLAALVPAALAALAGGGASHAAPSTLVQVFLDPGNGAPVYLGYERAPGRQVVGYTESSTPVYYESAPGTVISGTDLAGGGALSETAVLSVEARAAQAAQGGTLQFFGTTAEARVLAEYVLDDVVIAPVGPGPAPPFANPVFRIPIDGLVPDPIAQGHIFDTFLSTNFPNETFANVRHELRLSVTLRNASLSFSGSAGGVAQIFAETRHATGSTVTAIFVSGSFGGHEAALRGGFPFLAEAQFLGAPVGEPLELRVALEAIAYAGYGFPVNGGLWQADAQTRLASDARVAVAPVALLPAGLTLHSDSGAIVDNVWMVPEPAGAPLAACCALLALARAAGRAMRLR